MADLIFASGPAAEPRARFSGGWETSRGDEEAGSVDVEDGEGNGVVKDDDERASTKGSLRESK